MRRESEDYFNKDKFSERRKCKRETSKLRRMMASKYKLINKGSNNTFRISSWFKDRQQRSRVRIKDSSKWDREKKGAHEEDQE